MRALYRFLRSRELAAFLIVATMAYAALATLIPLGPQDSPTVRDWARKHPAAEAWVGPLGLHQPFTSPPFLVIVVLLIASTAACSFERTRRGLALLSVLRGDGSSVLRTDPSAVLPSGADRQEPDAALRTLGLRRRTHVRCPEGVKVYSSRMASSLASATFHWALVLLFCFAASGQLTRSEGTIAVVEGQTVVEQRASYLNGLSTGPLFGDRFTRYGLRLDGLSMGLVVDGVRRGDSPNVTVLRDTAVVARGTVYPNNPLRIGSVVVHRGPIGPAARLTITLPNGQVEKERPLAFTDDGPGGSSSASLRLERPDGAVDTILIETTRGARIRVSVPSAGYHSAPIGVGGEVTLPNGLKVRMDEATTYASLIVVNDWSVPFIYAAFALAAAAECFALFMPSRAVVLRRNEADADMEVWVVRKRIDPAFPERVMAALGGRRDTTVSTGEERT